MLFCLIIYPFQISAIGGGEDNAHAIAIERDGRIVVAGSAMMSGAFDFALACYHPDGSLDTTLGGTGKITTPIGTNEDYARGVLVREDGKIVVAGRTVDGAGYSDFALVRYNPNGSLDTTFSADGKVVTPVGGSHDEGRSVAMRGDGNLIVGGFAYDGSNVDFAVVRYIGDIPQLDMEWVTVGNINNPNDPADGDYFTSGTQNFGAVGYFYRIGKYEVTIGQYAIFLNQVAKSDPYGLWNPNMASEPFIAGISRTGVDGGYTYSVIGSPNRPVTYVNWFDAARFANWQHNGQGGGSTETGAYTLNGATNGIIPKNTGATIWIPSENEWYKAAYYDPTSGAGGGDNYWTFPYRSNSAGDNTSSANFFDVDYVGSGTSSVPSGNALTNVGAYSASASYYGTFDQGGNVFERNDGVSGASFKLFRGGGWQSYASEMQPFARHDESQYSSGSDFQDVGFRLAGSVPLVANFVATPASPRPNQSVSFDAASSSPAEGIVSYAWNWGDGSPAASGLTASHAFSNAGTYTVALTVTDSLGVTATKTSTVTAVYPVNIEWVTVGNPGNPADSTGYGAVSNAYKIGKYEVTIGQYALFLNAAAKSDPSGLWNPNMASDSKIAGISRSGSSGAYTYTIIGSANRPITYVNWFNVARFANWIHNGQPEDGSGTESGVYALGGAISGIFVKQPGASVWMPSENEWYKAAFYDPTPGAGGGDNFWVFATKSDSLLGNSLPGGSANYYDGDYVGSGTSAVPGSNVLTDVGAYGANKASYYGTYDQGGNVWEWNETAVGSLRRLQGGSWASVVGGVGYGLRSTEGVAFDPALEHDNLGFRLAAQIDATPPGLLTVSVSSSNSSPSWAKTGDMVTLSFTSDEAIQTPVVTMFGASTTASNTGGNTWTASVTVGAGTPEGATAFSITATDLYGNTASAVTATTDSSSVTVDRTAPVLGGVSNISVPATSAAGAVVVFSPTATDNLDASPAVNSTPSSGSVFPIGVTTVNVTATDAAGNSAAGSFTVTVQNAANAPHFATAGTVPVSASGFDATGMSVGAMTLGFDPAPGAVLTLIDNTSGNPITGAFTDLPDGGTLVTSYGGRDLRFSANYSGGDGNDLTLTLLPPEIVVELPVGTDVPDGGSKSFGTLVSGNSASLTFTIKNTGPGILNGLSITKTGADQAMFSVTSSPVAPVDGPSGSTVFTVHFTPTTSGAKTAAIHIASDDADENPFDVTLTGQALSVSDDTDGDGLNDAAEFKLAALGYDWQVSQPALVNTLFANADSAGLYTQAQVQTLHTGTPLIARNPTTGKLTLTMDWKKSLDLENFVDFPAQASEVSVDPSGDILFEFTSPDNAAFFRLEAK